MKIEKQSDYKSSLTDLIDDNGFHWTDLYASTADFAERCYAMVLPLVQRHRQVDYDLAQPDHRSELGVIHLIHSAPPPQCWAYAELTGEGCGIGLNVCPWNKPAGLLHKVVRTIIKRTSLFNRFFVASDRFFGYGNQMDPAKWWDLDGPTYGIDTRR